ncbi:dTDP-4-dehydrorhamnose 3,5-epimerase family protein [Streptomyces sp. ODS05-4]|uniref:dTDP-4-dehydrorhamnose 3,5-epimerase family protein n=1 Tax=Streptomyces sp. ODS05-4 TaxID=2944939 RepID=UPI00210BD36B|nr:dTDP-4-dehydrorhamnose 3,5-epimerase [Streptomyces sp. ODS05-4]
MRPLSIEGSWIHEPTVFPDERGSVHELLQGRTLRGALGQDLRLAQANCSISRRGTLRGIHFADVPPGQAKYVACVRGAVLDVIVDIRVGSPTFGRWEGVRLDDRTHRAVYLSEGLGHAFLALSDDTTVVYLCSEGYNPDREHGIHPLDPDLAIDWPDDVPFLMSPKDEKAPTLQAARRDGVLPAYERCVAFRRELRGS